MKEKFHIISSARLVNMASEWFEYTDLDHFWLRARFDRLKESIHLIKNCKKILEIGCGNGVLIKQLESIGFVVDGCDLNIEAINKIENIKGKLFLYDVNEKNSLFYENYDCIILFDVLEHIENDKNFLENALFHLKKGGLIVINVPAMMILYSKYDRINGHFRRYTKKDIEKLFKELNIKIIDCFYWGYLIFPLLLVRKLILNFYDDNKIIEKGFVPPSKLFNPLLYKFYFIEKYITKKLSWGTSLMIYGQKS